MSCAGVWILDIWLNNFIDIVGDFYFISVTMIKYLICCFSVKAMLVFLFLLLFPACYFLSQCLQPPEYCRSSAICFQMISLIRSWITCESMMRLMRMYSSWIFFSIYLTAWANVLTVYCKLFNMLFLELSKAFRYYPKVLVAYF